MNKTNIFPESSSQTPALKKITCKFHYFTLIELLGESVR